MQTVVTHSGVFDPDDVLAVATLQLFLGKENTKIVRTREKQIIAEADFVLDVGGIYDPETNRFDHHQKGAPVRENGIPYSSFGMVWEKFGEKIAGSKDIANKVEQKIVFPIDMADNQIAVCDCFREEVKSFEFFDVINMYKPVWGTDEDFDSGFTRAVDFAASLLKRMISQFKGEVSLLEYIESVYENTKDKTMLVFDRLISREFLKEYDEVLVGVSLSKTTTSERWMATVVPKKGNNFSNRAEFPHEWAGLEGEELVRMSGIESAVFCHKQRYIFVSKTQEGAIEAAKQVIPTN